MQSGGDRENLQHLNFQAVLIRVRANLREAPEEEGRKSAEAPVPRNETDGSRSNLQ